MPIVEETLDLPGGTTPTKVTAIVQLAGDQGLPYPAGYGTAPDTTIVGTYRIPIDPATGAWSIDLVANDTITPAGTVWRIVLSGGGAGVSAEPRFIIVPDGAGPFELEDLLTDPPGTIPSPPIAALTALVAALTDRVVALETNSLLVE